MAQNIKLTTVPKTTTLLILGIITVLFYACSDERLTAGGDSPDLSNSITSQELGGGKI